MSVSSSKKKYSIPTIIIGIILIFIFIYLFNKTTFFEEPLVWWKYLIIIPMFPIGLVLGIAFPMSIGNLIRYKVEKLGVSEKKSDDIAMYTMVAVYILISIIYFWVKYS